VQTNLGEVAAAKAHLRAGASVIGAKGRTCLKRADERTNVYAMRQARPAALRHQGLPRGLDSLSCGQAPNFKRPRHVARIGGLE